MREVRTPGASLVELMPYDCWKLLRSSDVGRVAWNGASGLSIIPVNITVADGAVWLRTTPYSALGREADGQHLVVEVDAVDSTTRSGWSVVASGTAEVVPVEDVSGLVVSLESWPAGNHGLFVRLEPTTITGRRLVPATDSPAD